MNRLEKYLLRCNETPRKWYHYFGLPVVWILVGAIIIYIVIAEDFNRTTKQKSE